MMEKSTVLTVEDLTFPKLIKRHNFHSFSDIILHLIFCLNKMITCYPPSLCVFHFCFLFLKHTAQPGSPSSHIFTHLRSISAYAVGFPHAYDLK